MRFSVIIPVYNRPDEIEGLLHSFTEQSYSDYSIIIVEDGSSVPCDAVVESYSRRLPIEYLSKANGGPGSARNYGARYAKGEYLIFLDSDTTIPAGYFEAIESYLAKNEADLFGGPDRSDDSFTPLQRAISYSMTSFFTTGGIRGGKKKITRFIPRSFNMGVRRSVFEEVSGFAPMRFGEDMDLSMRILESGHSSALIDDAFVYHKRRTSLRGFYRQVFHSGCARIDLSIRHKGSLKLVHLLPLCFILGCLALVLCAAIFRCKSQRRTVFCCCVFKNAVQVHNLFALNRFCKFLQINFHFCYLPQNLNVMYNTPCSNGDAVVVSVKIL